MNIRPSVAPLILITFFINNISSLALGQLTVTVGLVFDASSKNGEPHDLILGFKQAVQKLKKGGITLDYRVYDSKSNALGTQAAMRELLVKPPDFILAEVNSSKAFVAAEMAEAARRFLLTPMASAPAITEGKRYIFRGSYSDEFQGAKLADFIIDTLNEKKAAILSDGSQLYSKTLATAFKKHFIHRGGQVLAEERVVSTSSVFLDELNKIRASGAEVVFLPVYEDLAARILNEATRLSIKVKYFVGGDGWYPQNIFSYLINPKRVPFDLYWVVQYEPNLNNSENIAVIREIEKNIAKKMGGAVAIGYDSGMLLGHILKTLGRKPKTQDEIIRVIRRMPKFPGLTTDFEFGLEHDTKKPLYIHKMVHQGSTLIKKIVP